MARARGRARRPLARQQSSSRYLKARNPLASVHERRDRPLFVRTQLHTGSVGVESGGVAIAPLVNASRLRGGRSPFTVPVRHAIRGEEAVALPSPDPLRHAIRGEEAAAPPSPLPSSIRFAAKRRRLLLHRSPPPYDLRRRCGRSPFTAPLLHSICGEEPVGPSLHAIRGEEAVAPGLRADPR